MTRFERFVAKWLFTRIVGKSQHYDNTVQLMRLLRRAQVLQFTEDNLITLDSYMNDIITDSRRKL